MWKEEEEDDDDEEEEEEEVEARTPWNRFLQHLIKIHWF
jgi:hypothetical protein